ncbi:MAG: aminotransferase class-III [Bacteroidetes bacterium]|jgi:acetylornithine/N-succinyldiaminopimelate aminotransferase|nr:aminotransferase class-III [Bacteroidota bacterium]
MKQMNDGIIPFYSSSEKVIVRSKDCYQYDSEGKKYIDFESGVWCTNIGHCNDRIAKVVAKQAVESVHHGYRFRNRYAEELSAELQRLIGFRQGSSVFLSSGSEAVNMAITLSRHLTGRTKILKIDNSFLSSYGFGRISKDNGSLMTIAFNNLNDIAHIDYTEIAALVLEVGGASVEMVQFPGSEFITQLTAQAKKNKCVIVAEEVTTGIGRLGKWFGFQQYNITPDIVVTGKALGNGFPVSAVTVSSDIAESFNRTPFGYAQSHQNDPFGCAIGLEVIKIIEEEELIARADTVGRYFKEQLEQVWNKHTDKVKEVRACGLMLALELKESFDGKQLSDSLFEKGNVIGFKLNTLRFMPPLTIKTSDIDKMVAQLDDLLTD